jgi:hypothetical protein
VLLISIILLLTALLSAWVLVRALREAPVGFEDEAGFHAEALNANPAPATSELPEAERPVGRFAQPSSLPRGRGTATAH